MRPPRGRRLPGRRGMALALVMAFNLATLAALSLFQQHTSGMAQLSEQEAFQEDEPAGLRSGMSLALALMETGAPAGAPFICGLPPTGRGHSPALIATFESADYKTWAIKVREGAGATTSPCPASFGGE